MKGHSCSEETKKKISEAANGRTHSEKTKKLLSLKSREYSASNNKHWGTNGNKRAQPIFKLMRDTLGYENAIFAESRKEGEYKTLGYWIDFIDFEREVIIEWNGKHNYDSNGDLTEHDFEKARAIEEEYPDFYFLQIDETNERIKQMPSEEMAWRINEMVKMHGKKTA